MWKPTICRSFFEGNHIVFPHRWFTLGYIHRFESPHIHEHHLSTRLRLQATNFVFSGLSTRRPEDDVALSMGYHGIPRNLGRNLGRKLGWLHQLCSYTMVIHGYPWSLALSLGSFGAPAPLKGLGMLHGGCQWCHGVSTIKEPRHTEARTELQKTRWTLDVFWIAT